MLKHIKNIIFIVLIMLALTLGFAFIGASLGFSARAIESACYKAILIGCLGIFIEIIRLIIAFVKMLINKTINSDNDKK